MACGLPLGVSQQVATRLQDFESQITAQLSNLQTDFAPWDEQTESLCLEPQTTIYKWMFGETTIFYIKIWNHPIETSIYKWLFGVPGGCFFFSR